MGLGRQAGLIESRRSADHAAEAQLQPGDHAGFQGGDALLVPAAEAQAHQQEGGQIPELGIATSMAAPFLDQFAQLAIATELAYGCQQQQGCFAARRGAERRLGVGGIGLGRRSGGAQGLVCNHCETIG